MCMSPHEMTSARLEQDLQEWRGMAEKARAKGVASTKYYDAQADRIAAILKERAEDGSYHSDVDPGTGDKRY